MKLLIVFSGERNKLLMRQQLSAENAFNRVLQRL